MVIVHTGHRIGNNFLLLTNIFFNDSYHTFSVRFDAYSNNTFNNWSMEEKLFFVSSQKSNR
jgi:hypothetical protein